jgi:hypothetical protein
MIDTSMHPGMTTDIQRYAQAEGPHRPTPGVLAVMLDTLPRSIEVRAISINGQTGEIIIETYHEGAGEKFPFQQH